MSIALKLNSEQYAHTTFKRVPITRKTFEINVSNGSIIAEEINEESLNKKLLIRVPGMISSDDHIETIRSISMRYRPLHPRINTRKRRKK